MDPPLELEWGFQKSWHCGFYVVHFCPSPPSDIPLSSPSEDCMCYGVYFHTIFDFTEPIWIFSRGVCWGRRYADDWVEPWGNFGALYVTLFSTLGSGFVSHRFISFFS